MATKKQTEVAVVVTTSHRGVFFGYCANPDTPTLKLRAARNCIYWRGIKGVFDLAKKGPTSECRVGPAVDIYRLTDITSIVRCTPKAVAAWEKAPW